jgi:MATE family multidrug resistance protein
MSHLDLPTEDEERMRDDRAEEGWLVSELKKQFWLAGPMVCVGLLQFSLHLISMMFVGHLGKLELAAASIAISFGSVTGFSVMVCSPYGLPTHSYQVLESKLGPSALKFDNLYAPHLKFCSKILFIYRPRQW